MNRHQKVAAALILGSWLGGISALPQSDSKPAKTPAKRATKNPAAKKSEPSDPLAPLLQQAAAALDKKDFPAAAQTLESYLAQRPDDARAQFQLGYAYSEMRRWDEAQAAYNKAIALDPKLAPAHLNLGLVLLERDPRAAVEPFQHAAELLPDKVRPRFLLGLAYERSGNLSAAIEQYSAGQKLDPKDYEVRFALGRALLRNDRAAEAESAFREALAIRAGSAPAHLGLAESLRAQKKLEAAAGEFAAYLQQQPQDRDARIERAATLNDLARYDQALEELDRADAVAPATLESLKLRAEVRMQQKQWPPAAEALQRAVALAPRDPELHARLGHTLLEQRNFPAAEQELKAALTLDRRQTEALRDLVAVYYLGEQYPATLAVLDELEKRESPGAGSWFVRATCYDRLSKKPEALAAYQKFLDLDQEHDDKRDFQAQQRIRILTRELQQKKR
jgi:tetratricopeptide (TPR) repeat protein